MLESSNKNVKAKKKKNAVGNIYIHVFVQTYVFFPIG